MVGCCELGKELVDFIKCGRFVNCMLALQQGLCSMGFLVCLFVCLFVWCLVSDFSHLHLLCPLSRFIIIIIIIIITAIGLSPGGSGYFTCIQNMKLVTNKFKSGGLHEKHVVATWNVENHLRICL